MITEILGFLIKNLTPIAPMTAFGSNLALFFIFWIISVFKRDVSVIDIAYGLSIALQTSIYSYFYPKNISNIFFTSAILMASLRLSAFIYKRNKDLPEDARFTLFLRNKIGNQFWWLSLFVLFLPHALFNFVLCQPMYFYIRNSETSGSILFKLAGYGLFFFGFFFEMIADNQKYRFSINRANRGKVFKGGLWAYSRHPNFFGSFLQWWGIYLLNVAQGTYFTVFAPIMMTVAILTFSGIWITEAEMKKTKDNKELNDYMQSTPSFVPWPKIHHGEVSHGM